MKTQWYKGVPKNDFKLREERKGVIYTSKAGFDILTKIIEDQILDIQRQRDTQEVYLLPAYAFYQSDCAGQIKALTRIKNLIDIK